MKKLFKKISKVLTLTLVAIVSALSFVACSNSTQGNVNNIPVVNISDNNNISEVQPATPTTNPDDKNSEISGDTQETSATINGIYKFDKNLVDFSDIYYADEDELFKFFNLSDKKEFNSLYDVVKKLGFDEFTSNITSYTNNEETLKRAYIFNSDNSVKYLTYDVDENYYYIENERAFTYEVTENGIVSSDKTLILVYDAETKVLTIRHQFTYTENEETIYTPLYVETKLSLVKGSIGLYDGVKFDYVANSVVIYDVSGLDISEELELMAKVFAIEVVDGLDIKAAIEEHLAYYTLSISNDLSVMTLIKDDGNFTFIEVDSNGIYAINNRLNFQIVSNAHKLNGENILTFKVVLDNGSSFNFEYTKQI